MRRSSLVLLLLLGSTLLPTSAAHAKKRKTRQEKPPASQVETVVTVEDPDDPESWKEAFIEARARGAVRVRLVAREHESQGPAPLRASGAKAPLASGNAYRPVDTQINDPAYDGFPASFHAEPSISAQGSSVVCVFNDGGTDVASPNPASMVNSDGFSIATDGGASFRDQGKRAPSTGLTSYSGDNVVAAGAENDFFYVSDAGSGNISYNTMAVSRSTDGGRTWSVAANAAGRLGHRFEDGFFDKGWIAVDRSSTASRGNVYVTWSDFSFSQGQTDLYVSRSTDHGVTWTPRKLDTFVHPVAVTYVQVASNGLVYVGEQDEGTIVDGNFSGTNYVRVSTDAGLTFSDLRSAGTYRAVGDPTAIALCGDPNFFQGLVRYLNGPIEADSSLRLAVDPSDPSGRTVFVTTQTVPADRPGDASDISIWKSTDGGLTWRGPTRVNDDQTHTDQFMPDLWIAPDGTIGVLWLDRRNDPRSNWTLEAWMAISRDHGDTWSCNFPVSSQPFPPLGRCQMSDYNGVYADENGFHLAWGDGRQVDPQAQATFAIYGATIPVSGPGPILSIERVDSPPAGDLSAVTIRVRNDGTAAATGLTAALDISNSLLEIPIRTNIPFPDVPSCHGTAEATIRQPFAVADPYAKGYLTLTGPSGAISLPFSFALTGRPPLGTLLRTDFETDSTDWTPAAGSLWHVTSQCAALDPGHSGTKAAYFGLDAGCNYNVTVGGNPARVFGALTSRTIALPPGVARLRFKEWVGLPSRWKTDATGLQISTDGGLSFESIWGYGRMSRSVLDPAIPLTAGGRPSWHDADVDLTPYSGHDIILRFFFNGVGKASPGYAVDDIQLVAVSNLTGGALGTCDRPQAIPSTGPFPATASVSTAASASALTASESAPPCAPNATAQPFWFTFTPPISGTYRFTASCEGAPGAVLSVWTGAACGALQPVSGGCGSVGAACPLFSLAVDAQAGIPLRLLVTTPASTPAGTVSVTVSPAVTARLVPVVLDVTSGTERYLSRAALTNRSAAQARVTLTYTPSLGTGPGTVSDVVPAGGQLVLPDVIAYLRGKGLAIPTTGPQAGTLLVSFDGEPDAFGVSVETGSATQAPQPAGHASLAYPALPIDAPAPDSVVVYGLRATPQDRSKVALFSLSAEPVTVRVTAVSGSGDRRRVVYREAETLSPYSWIQYDGLLAETGISNGYVTIEKTSPGGAFGAYGVTNDNVTNDGSYLAASSAAVSGDALTVPVLVETPRFRSELILANRSSVSAALTLRYTESLDGSGGRGTVALTLAPGEQRFIDGAIDFLRRNGVPIKGAGASFAGALRVSIDGAPLGQVFAGARTFAPSTSAAGGEFGLFTPPVFRGEEATTQALLDGLRADVESRTNVALVNAGEDGQGAVTLRLQAFDAEAGGAARGTPLDVSLLPGDWAQPADFFARTGIRNGYVTVTRTAGTAPWFAYAVVNDGARPGERTDDGAYISMRR